MRALSGNLYKLWNRLASGSYFPPPVRRVEIPKGDGRTRPLGIPTVADRIAQMVVTRFLQPLVEPLFHRDSYGYRPKKSAKDALHMARQRCWSHDWALDLDIKGFFDCIDHSLLMRAIRRHTACTWAILYIERWLKAPAQMADGTLVQRTEGTPQGGVVSPLLANLYLHYAFDLWMVREYPDIPFERYADDVICHCRNEAQAQCLKEAIAQRFAACRLELHPQKTKVAFCKDANRPGTYPVVQFDFLGYSFQPRNAMNHRGQMFVSFSPAISRGSVKAIRQTIRGWRLHLWNNVALDDMARKLNPVVRGWINYYGHYRRSSLYRVLAPLDAYLARWAMTKYKNLRQHRTRAREWLKRIRRRDPTLFAHWSMLSQTLG